MVLSFLKIFYRLFFCHVIPLLKRRGITTICSNHITYPPFSNQHMYRPPITA
jgi:hypothetical protein